MIMAGLIMRALALMTFPKIKPLMCLSFGWSLEINDDRRCPSWLSHIIRLFPDNAWHEVHDFSPVRATRPAAAPFRLDAVQRIQDLIVESPTDSWFWRVLWQPPESKAAHSEPACSRMHRLRTTSACLGMSSVTVSQDV